MCLNKNDFFSESDSIGSSPSKLLMIHAIFAILQSTHKKANK